MILETFGEMYLGKRKGAVRHGALEGSESVTHRI
jgi:hypothetical protein